MAITTRAARATVVSRRAAATRLDIAPRTRAVLRGFLNVGASEPVIWISSGPVEGAIALSNATAPLRGFEACYAPVQYALASKRMDFRPVVLETLPGSALTSMTACRWPSLLVKS